MTSCMSNEAESKCMYAKLGTRYQEAVEQQIMTSCVPNEVESKCMDVKLGIRYQEVVEHKS